MNSQLIARFHLCACCEVNGATAWKLFDALREKLLLTTDCVKGSWVRRSSLHQKLQCKSSTCTELFTKQHTCLSAPAAS